MIYAIIATILLVIAIISTVIHYFKKLDYLIVTATFCFLSYLLFLFIAIAAEDPYPYWSSIVIPIGGLTAIWFFNELNRERVEKTVKESVQEGLGIKRIEYKEMSYEQAKKETLELITHSKKEVYLDDVVETLKIKPELVFRVFEELKKQKKIKEAS